ncbi:4-(cytidine 5'-diphospho)-2-C-methyl-D-erythritol kinase [Absicoccus porci]|uniref:4-diphosphocytidyl-2-C-methyl-D-erythritol kinase n=1 Tax=Absicoccus porci TaxID=2486576 RepID=A0A3N0I203_9FIRM|nr:4-(cytidine 5'-diphospho)-2-C-methyl-D-erythritol kinase [Absicoccus porci]RNM30510.1 4-(cytidine 5'-diphospho)-2-C-methyl-D-erythritol kinase [Absicoccus porci]
MKVYAPAKVNLALDVIGKNEQGYHDLDMIMAPVSLYNIVDITRADQTKITCTNGKIPDDNATKKMVQVLKDRYDISNYEISIEEHIPMQAGLAGASANAAAVLKAINDIDGLQLTIDEMILLGKKVGADVPFCVVNKYARVQGIGEKIRKIECDWKFPILLVKPEQGVSTPEAFVTWHALDPLHPNLDILEKALIYQDLPFYVTHMGNALQPAAFQLVPALEALKADMEAFELYVMMTGSGSTMMGFGSKENLMQAQKELSKKYPFVKIVTVG